MLYLEREMRKKASTPSNVGPQLEWWEKKASWQERQVSSPAIAALRSNNESQNEMPMQQSRQSRTDSLADYSASRLVRRSASIENHEDMERQISLQRRQSRSQSR